MSDGLINKIKSSINIVFIWGIEEGFIQGNLTNSKGPVYGLGFESSEEKVKPILTLEEVRKLLLEAKIRNHPWYPIWALALLFELFFSWLKKLNQIKNLFSFRMAVDTGPDNQDIWRE